MKTMEQDKKENKVHFAKYVNQEHRSGHLSSCGKWNPKSHVFFTFRYMHEMMGMITCEKCMAKTTLRDLC